MIAAICDGYARGLSIQAACDLQGVSSVAFHRYKRLNPEFAANEWADAEAMNSAVLEDRATMLAHSADNRSPAMLIFMLKSRLPDRYRENLKMEHTGTITHVTQTALQQARVRAQLRGREPVTIDHDTQQPELAQT